MANSEAIDKILPRILIGLTVVTGLMDAISFLSLGHVFTANMTGNVVLLAFATARVPEVSMARSLTALAAFMAGAAVGGRIMKRAGENAAVRWAVVTFGLEGILLLAATLVAIGYRATADAYAPQLYALIGLTAIAMGMRNATVRKLGVPELTTTVLTMTITGLAADSPMAKGTSAGWKRRLWAVMAMFGGAAIGALTIRRSVFVALAVSATASMLCCMALYFSWRSSGVEAHPMD